MCRIINNYVNSRFKDSLDLDTSVKEFKRLEKLVSLYECDLTPEIIIELIKNPKINCIIKTIVDKCLPELTFNKIEKIHHSYLLTSFVSVYAESNKIEIIENDDYSENNYYNSNDLENYLNEIGSKKVLTNSEERDLFERYKNGDNSAKTEIIECNLKLVVAFAKRYQGRGLQLLELIQEGNIGLLIALDKYNPNLGCRFSTYAVYWIRQCVIRSVLNKGKTVRIPAYWYNGLSDYCEKYNELSLKLNRTPTIDDMHKYYNIPKKNALRYHTLAINEISLNEYIGEEKETELGDLLLSSNNETEERVMDKQLRYDMEKMFEIVNLNPKEIDILKNRFGFYGEILTLQALADKYNLTRERIRQIELRALNKIRKNKNAVRLLASYTSNPDRDSVFTTSKNNYLIKK